MAHQPAPHIYFNYVEMVKSDLMADCASLIHSGAIFIEKQQETVKVANELNANYTLRLLSNTLPALQTRLLFAE